MIILQDHDAKDLEDENRLIMDSLVNKLGRKDSRLLEFNISIQNEDENIEQTKLDGKPSMKAMALDDSSTRLFNDDKEVHQIKINNFNL